MIAKQRAAQLALDWLGDLPSRGPAVVDLADRVESTILAAEKDAAARAREEAQSVLRGLLQDPSAHTDTNVREVCVDENRVVLRCIAAIRSLKSQPPKEQP